VGIAAGGRGRRAERRAEVGGRRGLIGGGAEESGRRRGVLCAVVCSVLVIESAGACKGKAGQCNAMQRLGVGYVSSRGRLFYIRIGRFG